MRRRIDEGNPHVRPWWKMASASGSASISTSVPRHQLNARDGRCDDCGEQNGRERKTYKKRLMKDIVSPYTALKTNFLSNLTNTGNKRNQSLHEVRQGGPGARGISYLHIRDCTGITLSAKGCLKVSTRESILSGSSLA